MHKSVSTSQGRDDVHAPLHPAFSCLFIWVLGSTLGPHTYMASALLDEPPPQLGHSPYIQDTKVDIGRQAKPPPWLHPRSLQAPL